GRSSRRPTRADDAALRLDQLDRADGSFELRAVDDAPDEKAGGTTPQSSAPPSARTSVAAIAPRSTVKSERCIRAEVARQLGHVRAAELRAAPLQPLAE